MYVEFYHNELLKNQDFNIAREYLKKRKLSKEDVLNFKIGFVPFNSNFYEKIKSKFDEKNIIDTGLFYFDDKKKVYVERFRDRIIFPINSITGQPIALGGRTIKENNYLAKYINSPETPFFKKGSNLYNLDYARKLSNKVEYIYLVEGYMDVVGLSSKGIENVVANLGTSLTDRQVSVLNQFYDDVIICFDGDESGYKAALRAAENLIKELKPEKQISFLFLPDKEDPDTFVNKNGKDYFLEFTKDKKIPIHNFILNHYKNQTKNEPSSLAIFEKKLRSIAYSIKDEFIKKYVLEYFLDKISLLTPNSNQNRNKKFYKKTNSLKSTQKYFNETKDLSSIEIKEYSFLYLIINNLVLVKENLNLLESVKLFTKENKIIYDSILNKLQNEESLTENSLSLDSQILSKISKFASIKHILKKIENDQFKIIELLQEVIGDIKSYELEIRIEKLESKFSKDLDENTFNELRELKKSQKIN